MQGSELGDRIANQHSYNGGTFRAIKPLVCLEFDQRMTDRDGNEIDRGEVGMPPAFRRSWVLGWRSGW